MFIVMELALKSEQFRDLKNFHIFFERNFDFGK